MTPSPLLSRAYRRARDGGHARQSRAATFRYTIEPMRLALTIRMNSMILVFAVSCGGGGLATRIDGSAGGTSAGGTSAGGTSAGGTSAGGTSAGGTTTVQGGNGGAGGSASVTDGGALGGTGGVSGTTACTKTECFADFPCSVGGVSSTCVSGDPSAIEVGHDVSCAEVCGTPCCSGGGCRMATESCSTNEVCAYQTSSSSSYRRTAACVALSDTCDGAQGNICPTGQYCEFFGASCGIGTADCLPTGVCDYTNRGGYGMCQPLPSDAECSLHLDYPVCGCDGITYANDCARMTANTALAHAGACP
jgi:hypothetical protein